jgi:GAF domain-containing protein
MVVAAARGVEGPHEAIADALLSAVLQTRQGGAVVEIADARTDEALEPVRALVEESEIGSALALGLFVADEPIGILAAYPRQRRPLSENERALLTALAAQLAVAVQNARLHERITALYDDLKDALASELEKSKRLHAHSRRASRSRTRWTRSPRRWSSCSASTRP